MSFQSSCSKNYSSMPDSSGRSKLGDKVFARAIATATPPVKLEWFAQKIKQFQDDGKIPELAQEVKYSIYRWKSGLLQHESIVVGFDNKFFTLEISFVNKKLTLYATAVDNNKTAWEYCESKITTGYKLIVNALIAFVSMGGYNLVFNKCQDFVNNFLKKIGLPDQVRMTDPDLLTGITVLGLGSIAMSRFMRAMNTN